VEGWIVRLWNQTVDGRDRMDETDGGGIKGTDGCGIDETDG
jgi:hypothetical protein